MLLKKRDLHDVPVLFELASHPRVAPYIRHKAHTIDEFYFLTKQMIDDEAEGLVLSRTILDEYEQPIGTINLFDIDRNTGYLATWLGEPYFGKGYNRIAKELFLQEVFSTTLIEYIFIKIKKVNIRSKMAILKLPYVSDGHAFAPDLYQLINAESEQYDLFVATKDHFSTYQHFTPDDTEETEIVS